MNTTNKVEEFLECIDSVLEQLNPPSYLQMVEPDDREHEEYMRSRLTLCFPNLTVKERDTIQELWAMNRFATQFPSDSASTINEYGGEPKSTFIARFQQRYFKAGVKLERQGIRAKLSDFQRKLLEHFMVS